MKSLIRPQFLDLVWGAEDLDAAADFWLDCYQAARRARWMSKPRAHEVEILFHGCAAKDQDLLRRELARLLPINNEAPVQLVESPANGPAVLIDLFDPSTTPTGFGLPLLTSSVFEGLWLELRITASGKAIRPAMRRSVQSTLVLHGELKQGVFHLKAMWRSGDGDQSDELFRLTRWPLEEKCLAAIGGYRESGQIPHKLAKLLFRAPQEEKSNRQVVWLLFVPLGKPRAAGLLIRLLILLSLGACLVWVWAPVVRDPGRGWFVRFAVPIWPPFLMCMTPLYLYLCWRFFSQQLTMFITGHHSFRTAFARLYQLSPRMTVIASDEAERRFSNVLLRQATRDLEHAGYRYVADKVASPPVAGEAVVRVFVAADGVTVLNVISLIGSLGPDGSITMRNWPARLSLLAVTDYADGGSLSSISGRDNGYRRKVSGPSKQARIFPDVFDPVEFGRRHAQEAALFAKETGRTALTFQGIEEHIRRDHAAQDEERVARQADPFTWGDAFRWYLQSQRPEYRPRVKSLG